MRKRHNPLKSKSQRGRNLARIRWDKDKARRDAEEPRRLYEMEVARAIGEGPIAAGDYVGALQWHGNDGKVTRWIVRRGNRSGQVMIDGKDGPRTATWLMDKLRVHISSYFRTGRR
jgi:hypothetical protein